MEKLLWITLFTIAKEAGFNKVVFIIRKDIFEEFEEDYRKQNKKTN